MALEIKVVDGAAEFRALRARWNALATTSAERSVFLTWQWLLAWWEAVSPRADLKIVCAVDGADLVGGAPLMRRQGRYYGIPVTEVTFVGDGTSDRQFFLDRTDGAATDRLWTFLLGNPFRATLLRLGQVPADSRTIGRGSALDSRLCVEDASRLPFLSTGMGWAAFEKTLTKKFKSEMRTRPKVFETFGAWKLVHLRGSPVREYIPRMAEVELASAKAAKGYPFLATPAHRRLLELLVDAAAPEIEPALSLLTIDERVAAYLFGFLYDGKHHAYNTAYLPEFRKASPGKWIVHEAIRLAFESGAREFDFLRGEFFMKHEWSPEVRTNVRAVSFHPGALGGALRLLVFRARPFVKKRLAVLRRR